MKKSLTVLLTLASIITSTTAVWADIAPPHWINREYACINKQGEIIDCGKAEIPEVHIKKIDPNEKENSQNSKDPIGIYLMSILLLALILIAGKEIKKETKQKDDKQD